jgi:U3 small nucleolar ribonucleoprotein component
MLTIKTQQIEAMEQVLLKRIEEKALSLFKRRTKNRIGNAEASMFIGHVISKMSRYNIVEEKDVLTFLSLCISLGLDFEHEEEYSWAMEILATRNLSGSEKVYRIEKRSSMNQI